MKRLAIHLADIAAHDNLRLASWKASRGKAQRPAVQRWLQGLDANLAELSRAILEERVPTAGLRRFAIHDPKPREISVHAFPDRVLHHAILNLAEPRFEQMLVASSHACRPGQGVHAAAAQAQRHLQRHAWWVQVDVAAYFAHIDHACLMALLARRFKGAAFLNLLERIVVAGAEPGAGHGLPIGALTSQHFANAYLDGADRWLLGHPAVRGHVRYMDDIVWWCDGRAEGRAVLEGLVSHLWQTRRLRLKPQVREGPSERGLRFCGFRIKPGVILPSSRKLTRFRAGARRWAQAEREGTTEPGTLQRAHDTLHATLAHTQSLHFRQTLWASLQSGV
jgi:RNA-directed DNA polymerase